MALTDDLQKFLHDISTPLTVALFHAQAAREKELSPELRASIEKLEDSLNKIRLLIEAQKKNKK